MKKYKAIRGKIKLYYDEAGNLQVEAKGAAKRVLEAEAERQAERDRQARMESRNAEIQSYETRYRKAPNHAPVSENASPAASDAQKDMPIEHGAVPETSPLLDGESPKHTDSAL